MPGGARVSENKQIVKIIQAPFLGLADTGAQTTCAGMSLVRALGLQQKDMTYFLHMTSLQFHDR